MRLSLCAIEGELLWEAFRVSPLAPFPCPSATSAVIVLDSSGQNDAREHQPFPQGSK